MPKKETAAQEADQNKVPKKAPKKVGASKKEAVEQEAAPKKAPKKVAEKKKLL